MCYNLYMKNVLLDKINYSLTKNCTKQERQILIYLKNNINNISNLTSKEIANECFVSTSAINRTVKLLGFNGYTEFKNFNKFSTIMNNQQEMPKERYSSYINLILDDIDYNEVNTFAEKIKNSDIMYVYGNGVSNVSSLFLFRQLLNIGYEVVYIPDLDMLNKIKHGTVICVSSIGTNEYVNDVLRRLDVELLSITKKETVQDKLSSHSITHNIDYTNASEIEREQQIQMLLLIGALIDTLKFN